MRILIVTQYFWPETFVVNSLATELQKKGHQVSVLTGLPNYPTGKFFAGYGFFKGPWTEDYNGVQLMRVPILARGSGFIRLAMNYLSFVLSGSFFSLFHKTKNFDVIFCFAPSPVTGCLPAIFIRALRKIPLVFWVQDLWPESVSAVGVTKSSKALRLIGVIVQFIYARCDFILVPSEAFFQSVMRWGARQEKIKYIPNWADPFSDLAKTPAWVTELPVGFRIAFAGNIGKAQDMSTLVKAAEILKNHTDIKWIVAGDGSEKAWLVQEIKNKNLQNNILTVGRKAYEDMLPFFKSCDAMLVSLLNEPIFALTIPAKVQAYMSSGRPIIASLAGEGARVIDQAECGLSCSPQSPEKLAEVVLKLKSMSAPQRERLGQNAADFFKRNFERSLVVSKIEAILQQIVSGRM